MPTSNLRQLYLTGVRPDGVPHLIDVRAHQRAHPGWQPPAPVPVAQAPVSPDPPRVVVSIFPFAAAPEAAPTPGPEVVEPKIEADKKTPVSCRSKKRPHNLMTGTLANRGLNNHIAMKERRKLDHAMHEAAESDNGGPSSSTTTVD